MRGRNQEATAGFFGIAGFNAVNPFDTKCKVYVSDGSGYRNNSALLAYDFGHDVVHKDRLAKQYQIVCGTDGIRRKTTGICKMSVFEPQCSRQSICVVNIGFERTERPNGKRVGNIIGRRQ